MSEINDGTHGKAYCTKQVHLFILRAIGWSETFLFGFSKSLPSQKFDYTLNKIIRYYKKLKINKTDK